MGRERRKEKPLANGDRESLFSIPAFPSAGKDWEREKKEKKGGP